MQQNTDPAPHRTGASVPGDTGNDSRQPRTRSGSLQRMAGHPTESWHEGMIADELRSWIESSFAPYLIDAWKRRDAEAWLSTHAENYRVSGSRYLVGQAQGDRVEAMKDQFSYRTVFDEQAVEVLHVAAPDAAVFRSVMRTPHGDELALVYAVRFSAGLAEEVFVVDDTLKGEALARDHIDSLHGPARS